MRRSQPPLFRSRDSTSSCIPITQSATAKPQPPTSNLTSSPPPTPLSQRSLTARSPSRDSCLTPSHPYPSSCETLTSSNTNHITASLHGRPSLVLPLRPPSTTTPLPRPFDPTLSPGLQRSTLINSAIFHPDALITRPHWLVVSVG